MFSVHSDAVSACTVHPVRLGETAGMPPVAPFGASGHGPCHRPALRVVRDGKAVSSSAHGRRPFAWSEGRSPSLITKDCRSFERPQWAGTSGRGVLFACRVATASETPSRERCGGLRRPGGPQSNRQFLSVVLTAGYAVQGLNAGGCRPVVGFIPVPRNLRFLVCERDAKRLVNAVNGEAFSSHFRQEIPAGLFELRFYTGSFCNKRDVSVQLSSQVRNSTLPVRDPLGYPRGSNKEGPVIDADRSITAASLSGATWSYRTSRGERSS